MKHLYHIIIAVLILFALSCNKSQDANTLEYINLNYDSLLVDSVANINPNFRIANLTDWEFDAKTSQTKENMLYFNNINGQGTITIKAYSDGNFTSYLQEVLPTFEGLNLISETNYSFANKIYHQYILQKDGFIILKAIVEIDDTNYIDTNLLLVESKYPELSQMIETYLASIAILN